MFIAERVPDIEERPTREEFSGGRSIPIDDQVFNRGKALAPAESLNKKAVQCVTEGHAALAILSRNNPTVDWTVPVFDLVESCCPELEDQKSLSIETEHVGALVFHRIAGLQSS